VPRPIPRVDSQLSPEDLVQPLWAVRLVPEESTIPARPRRRRIRSIPVQYGEHFREAATWDSLMKRIEANAELDDDLRSRALLATQAIRPVLGEDWPAEVYATDHPLARLFGDDAAHWTADFVEAFEALLALRGLPKWPRLVRSIRDGSQAGGAMAELRIAARAHAAKAVIVLEPATRAGRFADMLLTMRGCDLYVEVSVANPFPQSIERSQTSLDMVVPAIHLMIADIAYGGRLSRMPEGDEFDWLQWRTAAFFHQVRATRVPRVLIIPGLLEIWCVGREHPHLPTLQELGLVDEFMGPPIPLTPLNKLIDMIDEKVQQLPDDKPGMLVLTPPSFLGQAPQTDELSLILREAIGHYPQVVALTLVWRQWDGAASAESHHVDPWTLLTQRVVHPPIVERMMVVTNPAGAFPECAKLALDLLLSSFA